MARTQEDRDQLVDSYLKYLEHVRAPVESADDDVWEDFEALVSGEPELAWTLLLDVISRCNEDDLAMIGAGALTTLLAEHPQKFGNRFEEEIRSNERFLRAFQYAVMTGVPLTIQRPLNAALLEKGVDPKFVVEYDEELE